MHYLSLIFSIFFSVLPLFAQDAVTPPITPASETGEQTPAASSNTPELTPEAPENAPPQVASPTPMPTPASTSEDVIPLPPQKEGEEAAGVSEAPLPEQQTDEALPDELFADPNAVIPEEGTLPNLPPAPPSGPSPEEVERQLKVRYKEVRTQVEKDPAVRSLLEEAKSAKRFEDERAAYREYYRLLFKKMKKIDKALTSRCDTLERAYLARLAQTRVEPTIPLKPPPTPESLSSEKTE